MRFGEEYFKTEERDGFVISELMKKAWGAQLEVLSKIIAVCDKYNLTYYAYYGTLLGAVRHQGFIPWDDDLDIAMTKENYIKFLEVAKQELPEEYRILNCYTEPEYEHLLTRITNGGEIDLSDNRMKEYHGCPFSVGIDIFPLYYIPRNANDEAMQKAILTVITEITKLVESGDLSNEGNKALLINGLGELTQATGYQFTNDRPLHNHLLILYDQISRLFEAEESDAVTVFPKYLQRGYVVEKELLAESVQLPFENMMLNAPKGYDAILRKSYGEYMIPRNVRAGHDYPFYKKQLQVLAKHMEMCDTNESGQKRQMLTDLSECCMDEKTGMELPKQWHEKIYSDGKRKKIILYHTSTDSLIGNSGYVFEKLRYVFETFKDNENVLVWWLPGIIKNSNMSYYTNLMLPHMYGEFVQATEEFINNNKGIYDDSGNIKRAISMADAYYGDDGEVMEVFKQAGKPVMLQDYKITE